jgi:nucleoside triphosphate pyrophosphatase
VASLIPALDGRALVLASGSPRRRELLTRLGLDFIVVTPDVDETPRLDEPAVALVARLAADKAAAVAARHPGAIVIGADTAVVVGGSTLGKPADIDDARRMLRALGGRSHDVHTGVAVAADGAVRTASTVSTVTFAALTADEIEWYVATGEPFDKAGGYALQGAGGAFVAGVEGSVSGVLGLPLDVTVDLLRAVSGRTPGSVVHADEDRC